MNPFDDFNQYNPTPSAAPTSFFISVTVPSTGVTVMVTNTAASRTSNTAPPFMSLYETPLSVKSQSISGGAIAGIVIGILVATLLAEFMALCRCKKHATHIPSVGANHVSHGPTCTTVIEKIEPVVVMVSPANQAHQYTSAPVPEGAAPSYVANNGGYNGQPRR
ncbi:hypothetical protein BGZ51_006646 [Haplosporangium sp. Z 767]|nr:hypothetical protein BGZ51_006646 [Haplosporangium sp. Z 767]